jgi:putative addiction module component (TIGR02574 family)
VTSDKLPLMERNLKEVFQEAVQLPERDRATLAGLLIETLDPVSEPDVEAAWSAEIKRRLAEIDKGTVELISWEDVRSEIFAQPNEG